MHYLNSYLNNFTGLNLHFFMWLAKPDTLFFTHLHHSHEKLIFLWTAAYFGNVCFNK